MIRNGAMTTDTSTENHVENFDEIEEKTEPLPGHSANKPVYLVQVQNAFETEIYVSFKLNYELAILKVQGWKISSEITVDNLEDAEKHAKREQYLDIHFPWHRIISIRNITFKRKG